MSVKTKKNKFIPGRSFFLITTCIITGIAIIVRLFVLQILNYEYYQEMVIDNIQAETAVSAERGIIYDRNMVKIAVNYTVYRVYISPREIVDENQAQLIAKGLSELLGVDYQTVYENTRMQKYADRNIKKNVEEEAADLLRLFIAENGLEKQIHLESTTKRYYPYGNLASHVLGFVGTDGGLLGLELEYNKYLTGIPGRYVTAKDASGKSLFDKYETYIETQNGYNLVTTLDTVIQHMLENELERTFIESKANNRVTGIVMDVNTGGIYAMATYPDFDVNEPYILDSYSQEKLNAMNLPADSAEYQSEYMTSLYKMWNNKAVSYLYEPGSTFKVITAAMSIQEKAVSWNDGFHCSGVHMVAGIPIHCHRVRGHGSINFMQGLQQSCNPCMMMTTERLGRDLFYKYFELFGFTEKTGIDLPGEASPLFSSFDNFKSVELAVYSFGQTFKVTAMQQLTAIAAVANGGYLVTPHVVSMITDDKENIIYAHETQVKRRVISEEVGRQVSDVLEKGVSSEGGAKNAYVPGYKIAAKTGTSEVRDVRNEAGQANLRIGSCLGYAPADNPQIAVIIMVDQPGSQIIYGSYVAAPYLGSFFSQALPYMGFERSVGDETGSVDIAVTLRDYSGYSVSDVITELTDRGMLFKVIGEGETVTYQTPAGGSSINQKTGKVIIYTGESKPETLIEVPNVIGKSAFQANAAIVNAGLNILVDGSLNVSAGSGATVINQTPSAGIAVEIGTVVSVTLRHVGDTDN
ncbi:MAG: penicillin-binding transpeptidase domain-containing protein [Eubacteriales bacterium]|nr:penicillin-binding transpeptidase domain-containing protein [Eubacteriales bacterium]